MPEHATSNSNASNLPPSPLAQLFAAWRFPPELEPTAFLSMLALISAMQVSPNPVHRLKVATDQFHLLFPRVNEAQRFFELKLKQALAYLMDQNQPSAALSLLKAYRQLPQFADSEIQLVLTSQIPYEWRETFQKFL